MRTLLFALLCLFGGSAFAQADAVVFGTVKDYKTRARLSGFAVEANDLKWGRRVEAAVLDSGKYHMGLGRNGEWMVTFSLPGYVSKRMLLVLTGPTDADWVGGFGMNVDMTMLPHKEGVDYAVLEEPFGICRYNAETGYFEWDMAYTEQMRDRQAALLKALD